MTSALYLADSPGYGDNGGVHTNSGVGNKTAYLISQGGTFNGQTITGIDAGPLLTKTAKLYLNVIQSLTSGSDYADLARVLDQSCQDLLAAGTAGFTAAELCQRAQGDSRHSAPDDPDAGATTARRPRDLPRGLLEGSAVQQRDRTQSDLEVRPRQHLAPGAVGRHSLQRDVRSVLVVLLESWHPDDQRAQGCGGDQTPGREERATCGSGAGTCSSTLRRPSTTEGPSRSTTSARPRALWPPRVCRG